MVKYESNDTLYMSKRRIALIASLSVSIVVIFLLVNNSEIVAQQKEGEEEKCEYMVTVEGKEECWAVDEEEQADIVPDYKGLSSTELALIIKANKLYPEATILEDKITRIDEIELKEVAKNSRSGTLTYNKDDPNPRQWIDREDLAALSLYHGTVDSEDILAVSITNIGHSRFYIENLGISGLTQTGIPVVEALVIDTGNAGEASNPRAQITERVVLAPNETFSFYIKGKLIIKGIDEPAVRFYAYASFNYESIPEYSRYGWAINTFDYYLATP